MMSDVSIFAPVATPATPHIRATVGVDRLCWVGSVAIAAILFGLLANQHWVPGGDSELYVATARNLVQHHFSMRGYLFNGQPLTISPPGWPYILAVAMLISTRFWFLKLILLLSMVGSLALAYPICRRFASPVISATAIVLTAMTSHVFPLTFWLHSDAMFCLFTAASLLLALQIGEGRASFWRILLLCILSAVAVSIRYAGVFNWVIIAGALLQHSGLPLRTIFQNPHRRRLAITVLATFAVTAATFSTWYLTLRVNEQQALLIRESGGAEETGIDVRADAMARRDYSLLNADQKGIKSYISRPILIGNWFSYLYWQPFRFAAVNLLNIVSLIFGWLVLLPLIVLAIGAYRAGRPFWMSVLLYGVFLALLWPHANARYLVPIVYLLMLALWIGAGRISELRPTLKPWMNGGLIAFLAGFLACNGALYGVEVWAQRSHAFYDVYEAGLNKDLIASCSWLDAHHLSPDERIAVSTRYVNLSKNPKTSWLGLRVTTMLTGRPVLAIPGKYMKLHASNQPTTRPTTQPTMQVISVNNDVPSYLLDPDPAQYDLFLAWARKSGVKYYLYQPPVSPWRALHFRVAWLQSLATKQNVVDTGAGWRLYKIPTTGPAAMRILPLPETGDWPLRVPGL